MSTPGRGWGLLYHLHPRQVSARALNPVTTLGLGLVAMVLVLVETATGLLLAFYYVPSTADAYGSVQVVQHLVPYGRLVRSLHLWGGYALIAVVAFHLLRVVACACYRGRTANWFAGLFLGLLVLLLGLTGYLLPWDERSWWAVKIVRAMLEKVPLVGGPLAKMLFGQVGIGSDALLRSYALHVAWLPVLLLCTVLVHVWLIRRDGGLANTGERGVMVPAWPHLFVREAAIFAMVCSVLMLASYLWPASIGPLPDPARPADPEKAPWFFLGFQEMLSHSLLWGGFVVPFVLVALLVAMPFVDRGGEGTGVWWGQKKLRLVAFVSAMVTTAVSWGCLWLSESCKLSLDPSACLVAAAVVAAVVAALAKTSRRGMLLAAFVVLATGVLWFTIAGWMRGPGWTLWGG